MRHLVWFRNDLRAADNTALHEACRDREAQVLAVFIATPAQWREHDMAPVRERFLWRNVAALSAQLDALGIPLLVRMVDTFAEVPACLQSLCHEHAITQVFANREYAVNEVARDTHVADVLAADTIALQLYHDAVIQPPGLLTGGGSPYTVFTPYKRAWLRQLLSAPPVVLPVPKQRNTRFPCNADAVSLPPSLPMDAWWPAGEDEAGKRLQQFMDECIHDYGRQRDRADLEGTSQLSPWLAVGAVSARQCWHLALQANRGRMEGGDEGIQAWINELVWRDFYTHVLASFPRVSRGKAFRESTEAIRWRQDDAGFAAWCEGRTGIPIVDAGMRQLQQTGWMHNRLRMITAMFLTKNLLVDWRRGERFFMQQLIDGDLAANNGGWQWCASTGTDAAPYFRVFNPVSQSQKCDPSGAYIRRYVPELASLDKRDIHNPPDMLRGALGYPLPIVDLKASRQRAIEAFQRLRG